MGKEHAEPLGIDDRLPQHRQKPKTKSKPFVRVSYRCDICESEIIKKPTQDEILPQNGICSKCAGYTIARASMDSGENQD